MKKQKGFTLTELIAVIIIVFLIGGWILNAIKFASCDFESDYRCEVLHGVGVFIPPTSIVTVWFGDDGS